MEIICRLALQLTAIAAIRITITALLTPITSRHSSRMIVRFVIVRLPGHHQLIIMINCISRFIPARILTDGPFALNVTRFRQTLHHLHVCPPDVIPSPLQIHIMVG